MRPRVGQRRGRGHREVAATGLGEVEGPLLLQHAEAGRAAPTEARLRRGLELL